MTYAYDFISEEKNNPLELEPYLSINRKLKDCGDDISGKQIKYAISRHKSGFCDGFDLDRYYCDDVMLRFTFSKISRQIMLMRRC